MNEQHISSAYDRDLEAIQALIMKMGGLVETSILSAAKSLEQLDLELAEEVRRSDKEIDALEEEINLAVARIIALRSPTAARPAAVLTVMKMQLTLNG